MRLRRFIRRAREVWAEMDYASRRLIEIQTRLPLDAPGDQGPRRGRAPAR